MAKIIDLEPNSLCATEDAFENFQSGSMYEEDEYITLSDIVSPPRSSNDISEILNEVPSDDVSVSLQTQEPNISSSKPLQEKQVQKRTAGELTVKPNITNLTNNSPRKRGRKPKNNISKKEQQNQNIKKDSIDNLTEVSSANDDTALLSKSDCDLSYNMVIGEHGDSNPPLSTTVSIKNLKKDKNAKRKTFDSSTLEAEKDTNIKLISMRGRPIKSKNFIDVLDSILTDDENKKVNRRGRKKKILNASVTPKPLSNKKTNVVNINNSGSLSATVKHQKVDDSSNNLELQSDELAEEDMPLVALSNRVSEIEKSSTSSQEIIKDVKQKSTVNLNVTSAQDSELLTVKSPKKRGRPKKSNNISDNDLNLDSKEYEQNITKNDDISELNKEPEQLDSDQKINSTKNIDPIFKEANLLSEQVSKRSLKKPTMSDFEYNIDSIIKLNEKSDVEHSKNNESVMTESSRPVRRRAQKNFDYDEGSDEDPYANIESSDDDLPRLKKGNRNISDDEYIPGNKRRKSELSDSDISDIGNILKQKKKRIRRLDSGLSNKSPKKKIKKVKGNKNCIEENSSEQISMDADVDTEICLDSSANDDANEDIPKGKSKEGSKKNSWGESNEFENFLAKITQGTDIKIKKSKSISNEKTPLQIPVLDAIVNKKVEMFTQTNIPTKVVAVQTDSLYDIPMKNQVPLTAEQSERACEFLSGIVKTTSELGQLMTQKSEDFIEKKINTKHVTDTFKMDYCVKKSFLLFKLAKHNLAQMEEDLSKHYEEFLKTNNLLKHREEQKLIASTSKSHSGDSDCEIVEDVPAKQEKVKPAFNPKTVFLNKELSIKIAKKPAENPKPKEKLNIKGRHTVWINDSIMVKKVKPTQSFLAQDSRNKKPPDHLVTLKMVNDFFKMYKHQEAIQICSPFVKSEWYSHHTNYKCYFFETSPNFIESPEINDSQQISRNIPIQVEPDSNNLNESKQIHASKKYCPQSLHTICVQILQKYMFLKKSAIVNCVKNCEDSIANIQNQKVKSYIVSPLKSLCYKKIKQLIYDYDYNEIHVKKDTAISTETCNESKKNYDILIDITKSKKSDIGIKSLFSLCVELIQNDRKCKHLNKKVSSFSYNPNSLNSIALSIIQRFFYNKSVDHIMQRKKSVNKYKNDSRSQLITKTLVQICTDFIAKLTTDSSKYDLNDKKILPQNNMKLKTCVESLSSLSLYKVTDLLSDFFKNDSIQEDNEVVLNFTIDNVNTISEDVFLKDNYENYSENMLQKESYIDNNEPEEYNYSDEDGTNFDSEYREDENSWVSQVQMQELRSCIDTVAEQQITENEKAKQAEIENCLLNIKMEPLEELPEIIGDASVIKIEPIDLEETNFAPINVVTKQENVVCTSSNEEHVQVNNSNSYDVDTFEAFVSSNKMILSLYNNDCEEVFSQSTSRVRMQYEPDLDNTIETYTDSMNLLVPQSAEKVKDRLMRSSSDEDGNKKNEKKKIEKRKLKPKKIKKDLVQSTKEKQVIKNDIAILTRRMRDKIRQDEKKKQSSKSELEDIDLKLMRDVASKDKYEKTPPCKDESPEKEIQCNDVDSTAKFDENEVVYKESDEYKSLTDGTTTITSYTESQPNSTELDADVIESVNNEHLSEPSPNKDSEISELVECQPEISFFEDNFDITKERPDSKKISKETINSDKTSPFVDRHGWNCYPIDSKDSKIYQYAYVPLDKLPESFVETYFRYQDVIEKNDDDAEIDKLANLNSLHGPLFTKDKNCGEVKESKQRTNEPNKTNILQGDSKLQVKVEPKDDDELVPLEDETNDFEDNVTSLPEKGSDNCLAKGSLKDDNIDSEKIQDDKDSKVEIKVENELYKTRSGRLIKTVDKDKLKAEDLMLTVDKMMDKELRLLHAPVKEEFGDDKGFTYACKATKNTQKNVIKTQVKKEIKEEDDSSSEEEKQWFTTKERLLKRLQKKQDIANVDDAKRAKIVSEFIEKRGDSIEIRQRARPKRRSNKKLLERRKQMKILSRELFGEDSTHTGKKYSQVSLSKGRRNIRKVLDKKSLGRCTVLANMEEFERKKRLTQRQAQLREVLGCEEVVNVVVINDELCLEYDFEEHRPLVSVHPFFTKVMKAHQYEGVKFMWDSCFESVATVASSAGGGCILAHCMGLGKTLQVLALLHTVLTHPKVGMRRVLVCCPLSTVLNWVDEINKWMGPVTDKIKVFELSKLKKTYERAYQLEDWYNGGGVFIIGYELFRSLTTLDPIIDNVRPTIVNKIRMALLDPGPDMVICDEGHLLKNDSSVLAVAMSRVVTKRRVILTGTPMQNNLREYYCMVNFVKPNLLGTYSEYSNRFENPIMNGQHRDSREEDIKLMKARTHILHKVLEGCLQRQEASVLYPYLPKKHEYTVFITLTQCQRELYNHYLTNYTKASKQSVLKDFHVLQKIWTHPQVLHNFLTRARDDEKDATIKAEKLEDELAREQLRAAWRPAAAAPRELRASNKFLVAFRLLDECVALGDKVLIFSTSLYSLDALEFFLRARAWALGREYFRLDGSVPAEVRQKWCREFNAPHNVTTKRVLAFLLLFLISTRAGCLGLNMTAANRVIILDTSWNPAHDIQSIFRVYRFGQKKDCYIYRLVAMGTMEQKIYERSVTKQAVACRVVDEQQIDRHYNMSELAELYRLDERGVRAGLAAGVRDAALLRVARAAAAALHAVHEHDSLLRGDPGAALDQTERDAAWTQFQLEHAATHTEIQNTETELSAKPRADCARIEPKREPEDPVDRPRSAQGARTRRSRRSAVDDCANSEPSTGGGSDPDPGTETMIKKIMSILIQHDFHATKTSQEISDLVMNVRNVVANAETDGFDNVNPLIASIAKVVLENVNRPLPASKKRNLDSDGNLRTEIESTGMIDMPRDRDANNANENNDQESTEHETLDRKRRRQRRISDEEYVPGTSQRKRKAVERNKKPKTRKSNGNNVSKNFDDNSLNLSDLNEAEVQKTAPIEAETNEPKEKQMTDKTRSSKKKICMAKSEAEPVEQIKVTETDTIDESILLSDDDDDDDDQPLNTLRPAGMKVAAPPDNSESINKVVSKEDDVIIPLPQSLLTNKHFIKIVAHTYVKGNPMLAQDAAILAAQYSTLKALKESKATGKDITSGPIYDIAHQVLGKEVILKLSNECGNTKDISEMIKLGNLEDQNYVTKPATEPNTRKSEISEKKLSKVNKRRSKTITIIEDNIQYKSETVEDNASNLMNKEVLSIANAHPRPETSMSQNVVPVGMFKGPATLHTSDLPSQEECILPDDDDIIMMPLNAQPSPGVSMVPQKTINITKRRPTRNCLKTVASDNVKNAMSPEVVTSLPNLLTAQTINASKVSVKPSTFTKTGAANRRRPNILEKKANEDTSKQKAKKISSVEEVKNPADSKQSNETICLDSDEEDAAPGPRRRSLQLTAKLPAVPDTTKNTKVVYCELEPVKDVQPAAINAALESLKNVVVVPNEPLSFKDKVIMNSVVKRVNVQKPNTLSTTAFDSEPQKINNKICKSGDIIRITETGFIEVLRRTEKVPRSVILASKNKKQGEASCEPELIIDDDDDMESQNIRIERNSRQMSDVRKDSTTIENTQSKCKGSDPLPGVRNVIHITADGYDESASEAKIKSGNNISKISPVNKEVKKVLKQSVPSNKNTGDFQIVITVNENASASTGKQGNDKVIDLTDYSESSTATNDASKKITLNRNDFVAIPGCSKDIIINKIGLLSNTSKSTSVKEVRTGPSGAPAPGTRSAAEPPAKRSKPSAPKPMTLQDFNIDDYDDIIELE